MTDVTAGYTPVPKTEVTPAHFVDNPLPPEASYLFGAATSSPPEPAAPVKPSELDDIRKTIADLAELVRAVAAKNVPAVVSASEAAVPAVVETVVKTAGPVLRLLDALRLEHTGNTIASVEQWWRDHFEGEVPDVPVVTPGAQATEAPGAEAAPF